MENKYIAFISYRHVPVDQAVAKELHSRIEQYTIPKGLRKDGKKLGRVFRDLEELPASSNLSDDIYRALDNSENLIVVCSRQMAQSPWVAREVDYFLQHHDQEHVYTVLVDGEPGEVFPKPLLSKTLPGGAVVDVEPLAVDVRSDSQSGTLKKLGREMNRLLAAMIGCPYDALVQRQQKRQRRRLLLVAGAVLSVALLFSGMMLVKNRQIDAKNAELEQTNQQLEEQKAQLQLNESELLTGKANQYLETDELGLALPYALDAVSNADGSSRPYYAPGEQALIAALGIFNDNGQDLLVDKNLTQTTPVTDFVICKAGSRLVTIDPYNVLRCFDTQTTQQLWEVQATSNARIFEAGDHVLVQTQHWLLAIDVETGEVGWETRCTYEGRNLTLEYSAVSGSRMVVVGSYMNDDYTEEFFLLLVVDPETGETLQTMPLTQGRSLLSANGYPYVKYQKIGTFRDDGRYFAGCWMEVRSIEESLLHFYLADLQELTCQQMYTVPAISFSSQVYDMEIAEDTIYVLRSADNDQELAMLDAWSMASQTLLWQTPCQPEDDGFTYFYEDCQLTVSQASCAVGCGKFLFWIERSTGTVRVQGKVDEEVILLESMDNGIYQAGLADGQLGYVWPNSSEKMSARLGAKLAETEQLRLAEGGFLQLPVVDGTVGDLTLDGGGYVAYVRKDADDRQITITRAIHAGSHFLRQEAEIQIDEELYLRNHAWSLGDGKLILGPIDLEREEPPYQQFLLLDLTAPQNQTPLYAGSQYATAEDLYFTSDGKHCLDCDSVGNVYWYDTATGAETVLSQRETVELLTLGDTTYTASRYASDAALRYDGVTLAARLDGSELTIWLDGQAQTVAKPEGAVFQMQDNGTIKRLFWVGENGYVVVSGFADSDMTPDFFWVYDTVGGQWSRLDTQAKLTNPKICGNADKTVVLADESGTAWIYDLQALSCKGSFNLLIPLDAIRDMKLVQQDQFLLVQTGDKQMIVYDLADGQMRYQRQLEYHTNLTVTEDGEGRLYICWEGGGLCLDVASWQELTEIPGMLHYDNTTGLLLCQRYAKNSFREVLVIQQLPDLEELIRIGRELLASE